MGCYVSGYIVVSSLTCGSPLGGEQLGSDEEHSGERAVGHEEEGKSIQEQPSSCIVQCSAVKCGAEW